jgi:hypothetical protein
VTEEFRALVASYSCHRHITVLLIDLFFLRVGAGAPTVGIPPPSQKIPKKILFKKNFQKNKKILEKILYSNISQT